MSYLSVMVTRRGGLEMLQLVETELRSPAAREVRVRILAAPLCQDDVAARLGNRPVLPKVPFIPGYAIVGSVDAVGEGAGLFRPGERVAALTQFGGHAEYITLPEEKLVRVPETLDPAETSTLILNYLVAFQILHRVAKVEVGQTALVIGASGGVGTAFLQLGRLAGLRIYGLASRSKHSSLAEYGATLIDYHTQDFVDVLRQCEPGGIDFVFNGMDDRYFSSGLAALKRGGALVHYGAPQSFAGLLRLVARVIFTNLLPDGKRIEGYGTHRLGVSVFKEDWKALFQLLEAGQIRPIIAAKFPLREARKANALAESGQATGNIVLIMPGLERE
ncbi:MAG TPA: medium chain dehydrogenase/reductase family protein [Anaerolineaceae bacterium]|nr:medium chain dehydrogenase/reductase family protein [Anaerolineaceae bacterium]